MMFSDLLGMVFISFSSTFILISRSGQFNYLYTDQPKMKLYSTKSAGDYDRDRDRDREKKIKAKEIVPFVSVSSKSRRDALSASIAIGTSILITPPYSYLGRHSKEMIMAANAISSSEAETSYNKYASNYDALDGGSLADSLGIEKARTNLLRNNARGKVLEIGVGTGLNLSKYKFASSSYRRTRTRTRTRTADIDSDPNLALETDDDNDNDYGVTSLTLVDISDGMMSEAREKLNSLKIPPHVDVQFIKADATQDLETLFADQGHYFDTVVDTFSLCVMGNDGARRCLEQMKSVLRKETGRILLIENARSSNAALGLYQDLTADAAAKMGGKGCVSNQNVGSMIRDIKDLELLEEEQFASGVFRSFICKRTGINT